MASNPIQDCVYSPESDSLILATGGKVASHMGIPANRKAFGLMSEELHLGVDSAGGQAGVFGAIPDHNTAIRAHRCNDIRVLRLVAGLVDLPLVINFLNDVELDLHLGLLRAPAIPTDLSPVFVVILRVWNIGVWELHMGDLKVILRFPGSMRANQKTVGRIRLVWDPDAIRLERLRMEKRLAYVRTLAYPAATAS